MFVKSSNLWHWNIDHVLDGLACIRVYSLNLPYPDREKLYHPLICPGTRMYMYSPIEAALEKLDKVTFSAPWVVFWELVYFLVHKRHSYRDVQLLCKITTKDTH